MPRLPDIQRYDSDTGVRIYRIPIQVLPELSARVYLLLGAGPPTLVDAGSGHGQSTAQIVAGLETIRANFRESVTPRDIQRILLTHEHVDHVGGLVELVAKTGAQVGAHPLVQAALAAPRELTAVSEARLAQFLTEAGLQPRQRNHLIASYALPGKNLPHVAVDFHLVDGQAMDGLRVIHTPGHSPGHVCIAVGDVLLSGDHILARTLPQQWPESVTPHTGLARYLDSLARVAAVPGFRLAMGGHERVMHDVYRRIDLIRDAQMRRLDRVLDILSRSPQPLSIAQIAHKAYTHQKGFYALLALTDIGARIEYLLEREEITMADAEQPDVRQSAVRRYRRP